jgi:hypothetical protein
MGHIHEKPLKLSSNTFFFHGDLWTEDELRQRWHITPEGEPACDVTAAVIAAEPAS